MFTENLHWLDWIIIGGYLAFSFLIGIWFMKKASQGMDDYFLAGRSLPWWLLGTSMVATTFAADTPLAITEMVRTHGIWRNWWWWCIALTTITSVFVFSRLWRRAEVITDNELLELRYGGKKAAVLRIFKAGYFSIIYNMIVMGWVIKGMSTVIAVLLDLPEFPVTLVLVVIALAYATLSGFYGVIYTDLAQFILAMLGAILLAVLAINHVGGWEAFLDTVWKSSAVDNLNQPLSFFPAPPPDTSIFSMEFFNSDFFMLIVFLGVLWWSNHNADGGGYLIQRMNSAKNENHAMAGTLWFAIAHYTLRVWPWIIVALTSLILFPQLSDLSQPELSHKAAYPEVMNVVLPIGLKGLLITTFLAAFMSTLDTHLNWGASYFVNDIYKRFISPKGSEKEYVLVSRLATIGIMGLAMIASFVITTIETAWIFVTALGSGIGLVLILRWFWWRINAWSEISALATSISMVILVKFTPLNGILAELISGDSQAGLKTHWLFLIIVPITIIVWVTVTLLSAPERNDTLLAFYKRVRPGGFWKPIQTELDDRDKRGSLMGWYIFTYWVGAVALIYSVLFGIGNLVFTNWIAAGLCFGIALMGVALIVFSRIIELKRIRG
jgi:solute:Na+ symporter, SSS family